MVDLERLKKLKESIRKKKEEQNKFDFGLPHSGSAGSTGYWNPPEEYDQYTKTKITETKNLENQILLNTGKPAKKTAMQNVMTLATKSGLWFANALDTVFPGNISDRTIAALMKTGSDIVKDNKKVSAKDILLAGKDVGLAFLNEGKYKGYYTDQALRDIFAKRID